MHRKQCSASAQQTAVAKRKGPGSEKEWVVIGVCWEEKRCSQLLSGPNGSSSTLCRMPSGSAWAGAPCSCCPASSWLSDLPSFTAAWILLMCTGEEQPHPL